MTLYLKSDDNVNIDAYPYTYTQLRLDNPNKCYPKNVDDALTSESNIYPVTVLSQPAYDANTQYLSQDTTPVKNGATWELDWTINNYTAAQLRSKVYNGTQFRLDLMNNANFDSWSDQLTAKEYTQLVGLATQENWTELQAYWNTLKGVYTTGLELAEWQVIADTYGIPNITTVFDAGFTF